MNDVDGQICHFCPYVLFIDKCGCPLKKRNPLLLSSSSSMSASNVFEYLCHRIYSYSYSVFIFESNVFVFVFYFLNEYIPIRIRWSKYYLLTSVSLQHVSTLCTLHNAQVCGLVWSGGGRFGPPDTNYRYHI